MGSEELTELRESSKRVQSQRHIGRLEEKAQSSKESPDKEALMSDLESLLVGSHSHSIL